MISRVLPLLFIVLALLMHWRIATTADGAITQGRLLDTDSYARLMRVEQLWAGKGWYDTTLDRLGAPEGMPIHWTRPLDLLILGPAMVIHATGMPMERAIWWAGMFICPLLHALCCLVIVWAARSLCSREAAWFAGLVMLAQPSIIAYGGVGRADHHVLILLFAASSLGALLWSMRDLGRHRMAWAAGLWGGAGVWVGPEAQLVTVPALAGVGALWAFAGTGNRAIARQGLRVALGFLAMVLLAVVVELPPAEWLVTAYDKVSILHGVTALALAGVFAGAAAWGGDGGEKAGIRRRLVLGVALAGAALSVLAVLFPGFQRSALENNDPVIQAFVSQVREMQPIRFWTWAGFSSLLTSIGGLLLGLGLLPFCLARTVDEARRRVMVVWSACLLATLVAALAFLRFVVEFSAPAAIGAAAVMGIAASALAGARPLSRFALLLFIALAGTLLLPGIGLRIREPSTPSICREDVLSDYLRNNPSIVEKNRNGEDAVILTNNFNITPRLAYETPFRFIAGPYHRGAGPLRDTTTFFSTNVDKEALGILDKREVSLVILCRSGNIPQIGTSQPGNLGDRLLNGTAVPDFLTPLPLPGAVSEGFLAYRVQR